MRRAPLTLRGGLKGLFRIALGFLMILLQGCGWQSSVSFSSPSKQQRVSIGRGYSWMARIEIELDANNQSRIVYRTPGEAFYNFVQVCWSPDEKVVGVIVNGTGQWLMAFSTGDGRELPFDSIRAQMEQAIRTHYRVPVGTTDAIEWSSSTGAAEQFTGHPAGF